MIRVIYKYEYFISSEDFEKWQLENGFTIEDIQLDITGTGI